MKIKHELADRPFQPGDLVTKDYKPRPADLCSGLEVNHPQALAELNVVFRCGDRWKIPPAADLDVRGFIQSGRNLGCRKIRQGQEQVRKRLGPLPLDLRHHGKPPL